jgi:ABC-type nickel/cobalt efflux system permease component RcnA
MRFSITIRQSVLIVWIWFIPLWVKTETIPLRDSRQYMRDTSQRLVYSFTWPFISVQRVNRDEYTKSKELFKEQWYPKV